MSTSSSTNTTRDDKRPLSNGSETKAASNSKPCRRSSSAPVRSWGGSPRDRGGASPASRNGRDIRLGKSDLGAARVGRADYARRLLCDGVVANERGAHARKHRLIPSRIRCSTTENGSSRGQARSGTSARRLPAASAGGHAEFAHFDSELHWSAHNKRAFRGHTTSMTASPNPSTVNTARSPDEMENVGIMLPVMTIMPAFRSRLRSANRFASHASVA